MRKTLFGAMIALASLSSGISQASDAQTLGWGRVFTNDILGDGDDRWRTGGYAISNIRGKAWTGSLPSTFGSIVEYRFRSEIIAPENLDNPATDDRRYAGVFTIGAHTYFQRNGIDMNLGVDLVIAGPQTGLDNFQGEVHDLVGGPTPQVDDASIDNIIIPTITFEAAKEIKSRKNVVFRPFVEVQAGIETFARVGADVTIGSFGANGLRLRDPISGHRYTGIADNTSRGWSLMVGGDVAYVADSYYLDTVGIEKEDIRGRLRLGLTYEREFGAFFYGATYLSPEFKGQDQGQVVGSINARFQF